MNDTADILRRARQRLEGHWHQGGYRSPEGDNDTCGVCLFGAINWAVTGRPDGWGDIVGARAATGLIQLAIGQFNPARWNDHPDRTEAEVLAAFDQAIAMAEGER